MFPGLPLIVDKGAFSFDDSRCNSVANVNNYQYFMQESVVYVHTIDDVPFYVGAGSEEGACSRSSRSPEWHDWVTENGGEFKCEIIFRGTPLECREVETKYIEKFRDTVLNVLDGGYNRIQLKAPNLQEIKEKIGMDIKKARLRRSWTTENLAQRANISRPTLWQIEKGNTNVSFNAILNVLFALGFHIELADIIANDELGNLLMDAKLIRQRAPKKPKIEVDSN